MIHFLAIGILLFFGGVLWAESPPIRGWTLRDFTRYVALAVRRNLPLDGAIRAFADETSAIRAVTRGMLRRIARLLSEGHALSAALDRFPLRFPAAYRALVRTGERSGNLGPILDRLTRIVDLDRHEARRAFGYALYPLFVCFAAVSVLGVLERLMAPVLLQPLPGVVQPARLAPDFAQGWLPWIVLSTWLGAIYLLLRGFLCCLEVRLPALPVGGWLRWYLPILGRVERYRACGQFALAAGELLEAGVPEVEALRLAVAASASGPMARIGLRAAAAVAEGAPLSRALGEVDRRREIPAALGWFVSTGESSQDLPAALARAAEHCAERSRILREGVGRLVLPAGVLGAAVLVASVAHAVFGALVRLVEALP
ncbi:MAG: type II secretion system F family protein [Planctomycetes bacterium]|nr:type II secretion system F family protein [Planctomycetota bacterium]